MTERCSAILVRVARNLSRDDLEEFARHAAADLGSGYFERLDGNVALEGGRTHVYFWTRESALPRSTVRNTVAAVLRRRVPDLEVVRLEPVLDVQGADFGKRAGYHYVVEADAEEADRQELADWYAKEHLPALAAVPGNIRSRRLLNVDGAPRSFACYDLIGPEVLTTRAWHSVRETAWSSRVRPKFRNPRRTMFERVLTLDL